MDVLQHKLHYYIQKATDKQINSATSTQTFWYRIYIQ